LSSLEAVEEVHGFVVEAVALAVIVTVQLAN
jgi:hypothetical protein